MKMKVMIAEESDVVFTNKIDPNCIYAAYAPSEGHIIIITIMPDPMAEEGVVYGTNWLYADKMDHHNYKDRSLQNLLEMMIRDGMEVFEFESELDLGQWCIELFGEANTTVEDYSTKNEF